MSNNQQLFDCPSSKAHREETLCFYREAIGRAVMVMRNRLSEGLNMELLAKAAHMSSYHFQHTFREFTGITAGRFLAALRVERAKELLLTTKRSVTEICFEVGYNSLGTFSRIFADFVCLSPYQFRRFGGQCPITRLLAGFSRAEAGSRFSNSWLKGQVCGCRDFAGFVFIGAFQTPIPQRRPVSGTLVKGLGRYAIPGIPRGKHYVLAVAFSDSAS